MPNKAEEKLTLYMSSACGACKSAVEMIEAGKYNRARPPELVDVTKPENHHFITDLNLNKVPTIFKGTKQCELFLEDDTLIIDCGEEENVTPE